MTRKAVGSPKHHASPRARRIVAPDPRSVPIPADVAGSGPEADRPFEEGAHDPIDADLRHRMISEAAYALYVERNYADGYDVEDWLAAEAAVDHVLLERAGAEPS